MPGLFGKPVVVRAFECQRVKILGPFFIVLGLCMIGQFGAGRKGVLFIEPMASAGHGIIDFISQGCRGVVLQHPGKFFYFLLDALRAFLRVCVQYRQSVGGFICYVAVGKLLQKSPVMAAVLRFLLWFL